MALNAAAQRPSISAIVLLACPGRPFRDLLKCQLNWVHDSFGQSGEAKEFDSKVLEEILAIVDGSKPLPSGARSSHHLYTQLLLKLYKSLIETSHVELIAASSQPILVVQGTSDVQVTTADSTAIMTAARIAQRPATEWIVEDLNHLFRREKNPGKTTLNVYADRRRKVPVTFIRALGKRVHRMLQTAG